jgi:chaperonin cofactor prefoldin
LRNQELKEKRESLKKKLECLENSLDTHTEDLENWEYSSIIYDQHLNLPDKSKSDKPRRMSKNIKSTNVFKSLPDQVIALEVIKSTQETHIEQIKIALEKLEQENLSLRSIISDLSQLKPNTFP